MTWCMSYSQLAVTSRFSRWSERHRAITQCDRSIDSVSLSVDSRETDLSLSRRSRLTYVVRRLVVFDQFLFKCVCLHSSLPHAGQSAAAVTSIIGDLILVVGSPGLAAAARRRWRRRNLLLLSLSLWCRAQASIRHPCRRQLSAKKPLAVRSDPPRKSHQ